MQVQATAVTSPHPAAGGRHWAAGEQAWLAVGEVCSVRSCVGTPGVHVAATVVLAAAQSEVGEFSVHILSQRYVSI